MNTSFVSKIGFVLVMSLLLVGCQAANVQPATSTREVQNVPNTPYTKGPSGPPGVKGPTTALPGSDAGAQ